MTSTRSKWEIVCVVNDECRPCAVTFMTHTHLQRFYTWKNSEYEQRRHTNQGGCRAAQCFLKCMDFISKDKNGNCQLLQYNGLNIYTSILVSKVHIQPMFIYGYDVEENFLCPCVSRALVDSVWMNECKGNTEVSPALLRLPQRQKKVGRESERADTNRVKPGSERGWLCWLSLLLWKQHDRADWLCRGIATCACASSRHTHCTHAGTHTSEQW